MRSKDSNDNFQNEDFKNKTDYHSFDFNAVDTGNVNEEMDEEDTYFIPNGDIYEGGVNDKGLSHGHGINKLPDGYSNEGEWENGYRPLQTNPFLRMLLPEQIFPVYGMGLVFY